MHKCDSCGKQSPEAGVCCAAPLQPSESTVDENTAWKDADREATANDTDESEKKTV